MTKSAIIAAAVFLLACAWVAASSAIYCGLAHKWPLYEFPYLQIIDVWPWRHANWLLAVIVYASVALPVVPAAAALYMLMRWRLGTRPLYGQSRWATPGQMRKSGMRVGRNPFR